MPTLRNIGGTWRNGVWWRNVGGVWKQCVTWRRIGGGWRNLTTPVSTLSANKTEISANGYNAQDQANITSTVSTNFTFTLISGGGTYTTGPASGTSTFVRVTTPATGNAEQVGVVRVTATNGEFIDIQFTRSYGNQ